MKQQPRATDQALMPIVPPDTDRKPDVFLRRIQVLLDAHPGDQAINVEWLAGQLTMNRKTLYRQVQHRTQLSPTNLIRQYRLHKAADLLKASHTVTETAWLAGFRTPSHFTAVFREFYGQTPTEFVAGSMQEG